MCYLIPACPSLQTTATLGAGEEAGRGTGGAQQVPLGALVDLGGGPADLTAATALQLNFLKDSVRILRGWSGVTSSERT